MYIVYSLDRQLIQDYTHPSFQPIVTMVNIHVEIWVINLFLLTLFYKLQDWINIKYFKLTALATNSFRKSSQNSCLHIS